jgi:hypothetical protein
MPFSTLAFSAKGKRVIRAIEGWTIALVLPLGGAVAGYSFSEYRLNVIVTQVIADHDAESKRLRDTNEGMLAALAALTMQVRSAAQQADRAGAKAADAANQSAQAAQTANSAAVESAKSAAVVRNTRPTIVVSTPVAVPEPARVNLNRAIERTNRKIEEHK